MHRIRAAMLVDSLSKIRRSVKIQHCRNLGLIGASGRNERCRGVARHQCKVPARHPPGAASWSHGVPHQRHDPQCTRASPTKRASRAPILPPSVTQTLSLRLPGSELSHRERAVLKLMVGGKSNREIGEELRIKETTVKSHITLILMRMNVTDRTQAVVEALKRGLEHL